MTKKARENTEYEHYKEKYWTEAQSLGIPCRLTPFPPYQDREHFNSMITKSERIFTYLARNLREILRDLSDNDKMVVFALYGRKDKCMLGWWGSEESVAKLRAAGIGPGTVWRSDILGPNAITVGLVEGVPMKSIGDENYNLALRKYAIYFSPARIKYIDPRDGESNYGLAVFAEIGDNHNDYLMAVSSIAYGLMVTLHFNQVCRKLYSMMQPGFIGLDSELKGRQVSISFHDAEIINILGLPSKDYSFQPLDALIDPLPSNPEFWDLIEKQKEARDMDISLVCRGTAKNYILTMFHLHQPGIGSRGGYIHLTTQQRTSSELSRKLGSNAPLTTENIIGESSQIKSAIQRCRMLSKTNSNVLLLGESGVGKDVFAQALHNMSSRANGPFVAINCGALPRELIASELFGYEGGSFTGAKRQGNIGKFELANGGTIFLDEIGELPYDLQATLLRVVESKKLTRIGGKNVIDIDVKVISATNEDLLKMIDQHRFRLDLYYRLCSMYLKIPPLRERGEDIILLAEHFISTTAKQFDLAFVPVLSDASKRLLRELPWRGNVRELQNVAANVVQLYQTEIIEPEQILENVNMYHPDGELLEPFIEELEDMRVGFLTEDAIQDALKKTGGNRSAAAKLLKVSRATLYRNMHRLGMSTET